MGGVWREEWGEPMQLALRQCFQCLELRRFGQVLTLKEFLSSSSAETYFQCASGTYANEYHAVYIVDNFLGTPPRFREPPHHTRHMVRDPRNPLAVSTGAQNFGKPPRHRFWMAGVGLYTGTACQMEEAFRLLLGYLWRELRYPTETCCEGAFCTILHTLYPADPYSIMQVLGITRCLPASTA